MLFDSIINKDYLYKLYLEFMLIKLLFIFVVCFLQVGSSEEARPDIVLIIVDDLNDWVGCLEGHPDAHSPNIDALANNGMLFTQAYCNIAHCRPSRLSMNHGIYPFKTGTYFNARYPREKKIKTPSIQQFFLEKGYRVVSGGKVFHGGSGKVGDVLLKRPKDPSAPILKSISKLSGPPNDGYPLDVKDYQMGDYKVAKWAIKQWNTVTEKPLFMSIGFYRPHRPFQVPKHYFERFPLSSIRRPAEPIEGDDWDDLPIFSKKLARSLSARSMIDGMSYHEYMVKNDHWDSTIQAYHACVSFVDRQIGRLLKSLQENPRERETYIILVSDHGWHLGEKKHWSKCALWEQTTHIPFIVTGSSIKPSSICRQPVSLIDVYSSLVDLAGFKIPSWLDGQSIKPQLIDPSLSRPPVICSYGAGNTAIRTERWRYIRYEDGSEELYDHDVDPNEWKNLAKKVDFRKIKDDLRKLIPENQHSGLRVQAWFDQHQLGYLEEINQF